MPSKLLLLEDSPTVREVIKIYLSGGQFEFHEAGDAQRGLQLARLLHVDLVIADIKMPGMSGIEFVRALRADPDERLKRLPVVLLTGEKGGNLRSEGLGAGANAFVEKPVTGPALREAITALLHGTKA
jgi:two-component system, chemotaxis family, chemotaxis protein CheY